MEVIAPDIVIIFGVRTILSFLGVVTVAVGFWAVERKWDEEGAAAYAKALENAAGGDYQMVEDGKKKKFVTNPDGSRDAISVNTDDFEKDESPVDVPREELEKAMPVPMVLLVGFGIWAFSFLFVATGGFGVYSGWNLCFVIFLPAIGFGIAYPIRKATIDRDLELKKKAVSCVLIGAIWLMMSGILDSGSDAPWFFCFFGVLFLFMSYHIIRRSRKMGVSWEVHGRPNLEITSQSLGALTMIFGLFLFWVGTNAQAMTEYQSNYIPIYVNYRAWLVFVSGLVIIVPSLMALDLAFDEGSEPIGHRLDGRVLMKASQSVTFLTLEPFAKYLETPWPLIAGWIIFGLCALMPFGGGFTIQKLFVVVICFSIGPIYGLKVLPAYWAGEAEEYRKWTYVYYALMVFLFTAIGVDGEGPLIMAMMGVIFIFLGQRLDMLEKKRGKQWIQHKQFNTHTVAFGYGQPVYVVGWILLCLAMAIPM